jgi:PAS domain S-box-containing protein
VLGARNQNAPSWRGLVSVSLGALFLVALLVGSYSFYLYSTLSRGAEDENLAANQAQAEMSALFVEDHQERLLERLTAIASRNVLKNAVEAMDLQELRSFLEPLVGASGEIASAFLADRRRRCLLSLPQGGAAQIMCAAPQTARPWVSPVHEDPFKAGQLVVTLSAPIWDRAGNLMGYLGLHQKISHWHDFFKRPTARPGRTFHLMDQEGRLVAAGPGPAAAQETELASLAQAARHLMLQHDKPLAWLTPVSDGKYRAFAAAAPLQDIDWVMVVLQAYEPAMAPSRAMYRNSLLFLGLFIACLAALGAVLVSRYRIQQKLIASLDKEARHLEELVAGRTADLQESTERYRRLLEDLPDVVYEVDQDGRIVFVSRAVQNLLGYRPSEVHGRLWRDLVYPEDRVKFDRERAQTASGQAMSILALRHLAKSGEVRWLSIHSREVVTPRGQHGGRRGVARDVTAEVLAEQRVHELSGRLISAQEDERKKVALDLHDEMGQLLSALKMGLQALMRKEGGDNELELTKLIQLSQKIMDRTRALAYRLRPSILDSFGLKAALEDLCESLSESGMIQVDYHLDDFDQNRLKPDASIGLFRFAQEALTNAVKHSGSPGVEVRLEAGERRLKLSVRDFGKGFDHEKALFESRNLGLLGMHERLSLLGGGLKIVSMDDGTVLQAELPLED